MDGAFLRGGRFIRDMRHTRRQLLVGYMCTVHWGTTFAINLHNEPALA